MSMFILYSQVFWLLLISWKGAVQHGCWPKALLLTQLLPATRETRGPSKQGRNVAGLSLAPAASAGLWCLDRTFPPSMPSHLLKTDKGQKEIAKALFEERNGPYRHSSTYNICLATVQHFSGTRGQGRSLHKECRNLTLGSKIWLILLQSLYRLA